MKRRGRSIVFVVAFGMSLLSPASALRAREISVQCPRGDTPIVKQIRFARGRTTAAVTDRIRLCTSHDYRLRARAGQTMTVHLAAGDQTSFTIFTPTDRIESADGVRDWSGVLPETGQYEIQVATDVTTRYTLEVTIR